MGTTKLNNDLGTWGGRRVYVLAILIPGIGTLASVAAGRDRFLHLTLQPDHIAWGPTVASGVGWLFILGAVGLIVLIEWKRGRIRRAIGRTNV